jgi:uncharacterized protein (DUF1697 family)
MPRYIAFLRAINVGGHNVKMDHLRGLFEGFGFDNVETFIASGNVIFETASKDTKALEGKIETGLKEALGYEVATFIRTDAEVTGVAQYRPFPQPVLDAAGALNIAFMADPVDENQANKLMTLRTDIDDFHIHQREMYWLCKVKQSESTFSNASFEKALGIKATFRGVNTVKKLAAKYPAER